MKAAGLLKPWADQIRGLSFLSTRRAKKRSAIGTLILLSARARRSGRGCWGGSPKGLTCSRKTFGTYMFEFVLKPAGFLNVRLLAPVQER